MSNLRKFKDEERESEYGRVYAVSGPGKRRHQRPSIADPQDLANLHVLFFPCLLPFLILVLVLLIHPPAFFLSADPATPDLCFWLLLSSTLLLLFFHPP